MHPRAHANHKVDGADFGIFVFYAYFFDAAIGAVNAGCQYSDNAALLGNFYFHFNREVAVDVFGPAQWHHAFGLAAP